MQYTCDGCGTFVLTGTAEAILPPRLETPRSVAVLRHWIRRHQSAEGPPSINGHNLDEILGEPLPTASEQARLLLACLARAADGEAGRWIEARSERLCAEAGVVGDAGIVSLLEGLKADGLIEWRHRPSGQPGVQARLTLAGWRDLEQTRPIGEGTGVVQASGCRVFVSHTSGDKELVKALVDLLRAALGLPGSAILCTSLEGHRLEGGADVETMILQEVGAAEVMLAVVTPGSLESLYVAFEMGARWHSKRPLKPLLARGVTAIPRPLDRLNALRLDLEGDVHQLVDEVAQLLNLTPSRPQEFAPHLRQVVEAAKASEGSGRRECVPPSEEELLPGAIDLMVVIRDHDGEVVLDSLVELGGRSAQMTQLFIDSLRDRGLVWISGGGVYRLSPKGRSLLYERGLLE